MLSDVLFDAVHEIERCQRNGWGDQYDDMLKELTALKSAMRKVWTKLDGLPCCKCCGGPLESPPEDGN
jgi:hypothetical protein